ncbi:PqqD family protein [Thermomonas sp. HDW16]|uniref:PqqD family protein n=1 Tax=Thermomonas sp. HDW16 TaxID=2714945 RepID=UPI001408221B|nr:PqqD family protein [Thermomonas sp. HDW16]QIL20523.1 PqqD family protein [Thermomonas sp. HDW16]
MNDSLYILRSSNVAARRIGDELMIMSAHDSSLFSLNETAAILWDAADGLTPLADIVAQLIAPVFDIDPATALEDARSLALGLAERGILQVGDMPFTATGDGA